MTDIIELLQQGGIPRRSADGLKAVAERLNCEVAVVHAIVDVESNGSGIDAKGRVKVLFEKHRFYKNLPASKRAAAVKAGLGRKVWISPKNGGYKDQPSNEAALAMLIKAVEWCRANGTDEAAALKSASYGTGQVLGENFALCGWASVQAFVADMCQHENKHVDAMIGFLVGSGLADEMRARDFDAVARVYNGSGQVETYGGKMRKAYAAFTGKEATIESTVRAAGLRIGSEGYRVEALQKRLDELGFPVRVDGDFGENTRKAVVAFQAVHGLEVDGVVGALTQLALDVAKTSIPEARATATIADLRDQGSSTIKEADKTQAVSVVTGAVAVAGAANEAGVFDKIKQASDAAAAMAEPLGVLVSLVSENWWLLAGGAGVALYFFAKRIKETRLAGHQAGRIV
ncbi:N-acetylmuramidase domain-containing protein [Neorhizobium sp. T786]|uniref:N-acetylmuramidase domain-containing protein n=1 Tax=Pseudorhizobium xiangyangii TaxID=2883104 RepID=UPI001CFFD8CD|nr:N-acetylmuramidase domain-containing protein [Neorhizobium xiangyangii]MCB5201735.1 N-acetylmuramidase domain-containing protein [Neorhizobium xiangyangii]